jgi:hypothetical protein
LKAKADGEDLIAARARDCVADCIINDQWKVKRSRSLRKNRGKDLEKDVKLWSPVAVKMYET